MFWKKVIYLMVLSCSNIIQLVLNLSVVIMSVPAAQYTVYVHGCLQEFVLRPYDISLIVAGFVAPCLIKQPSFTFTREHTHSCSCKPPQPCHGWVSPRVMGGGGRERRYEG